MTSSKKLQMQPLFNICARASKALSEKIIESDVNAMGPVFLHDVYQSGEQFDILKKKLNARHVEYLVLLKGLLSVLRFFL